MENNQLVTLQNGITGKLVSIEAIDGVEVYNVILPGDADPTEFLSHEIKDPTASKLAPFRTNNSNNLQGEISSLHTMVQGDGFKACPEAGIFTPENLAELDISYEKSRWMHSRREELNDRRASHNSGKRETLGTTKRYHQTPGTATIYGGRK